jgi:SAM-dependent methyltransferase
MKKQDRDRLHEYYDGKLKTYGHDTRSLGWIPGARDVRLGALTSIGDLEGASILDVGCGFGDLYGHLLKRGIKTDYTGIDIMPEFIDIAKSAYPDASFIAADIEGYPQDKTFDWSFASGIFTIRISDNRAFIKSTLKKMFSLSTKGFAADFLVDNGVSKADAYWQCKPEEVLRFCRTLSKRVALRCDYMSTEFCVYVYKNDMSDERNVFEEHQKGD